MKEALSGKRYEAGIYALFRNRNIAIETLRGDYLENNGCEPVMYICILINNVCLWALYLI